MKVIAMGGIEWAWSEEKDRARQGGVTQAPRECSTPALVDTTPPRAPTTQITFPVPRYCQLCLLVFLLGAVL